MDEVLGYRQTVGGVASVYYPHGNHLYSVAALTNAAGQVVERYTYTAYGKQTITGPTGAVRAKSAVGFDRGFTGYVADNETGLLHARARQYSPTLGRFIGRDPWTMGNGRPSAGDGYQGSYSFYSAVFAPNGLDPSGMVPDLPTCTLILNNALANDPGASFIVGQLKKKKCKVPSVECICCDPRSPWGGEYKAGKITVCNFADSRAILPALRHELQHSLDVCNGTDFNNCDDRACSEVRAYSGSGQCNDGGLWRRTGESRWDCVRRNAITSVGKDEKCKPKAGEYVDAAKGCMMALE